MTSKAPWQAQIRAALVLLVGLWMLVLGLPGFDTLRTNELQDPEERARAFADYPDPAVHLALGLIWWNREVRLPVVAAIEGSQRPFRLAQTWAPPTE